jgi:enterochelin esterase family protein
MFRYLLPFLTLNLAISIAIAQVSPEILEDGRVTFRINAPNADTVTVKGQWPDGQTPLTKGEKDLWEGTTPEPVPAGVWEYGMMVDKMRTIDARNPVIKPQRWPKTSILHIKSNPPDHWDLQKIPHGTLHSHDYWSNSLKAWRKLVVYTPPNYHTTKKPLPILYLSHGFSDNQASWSTHGKAHSILDSLINQKAAKPMLIVMPDAHPVDPEARVYETYGPKNTQAFAKEMVNNVLPFVEKLYNVQTKSSGRAFAGLSMGGGHAFTIAFQHHDMFSQISGFSSAPPPVEYIKKTADVEQMNRNLKLFHVICGDADFLFERNEETHAAMNELGIDHEYVITPGDNHSWPVWRGYLIDLLPRLF